MNNWLIPLMIFTGLVPLILSVPLVLSAPLVLSGPLALSVSPVLSVPILLSVSLLLSVPPVLSAPREYYLIQQGKSWSDAQAYCRAEYTDLAIIMNNEDLIRLQNEAQTQQFSSNAWVGLEVNVSSWRWSMGNEPLGSVRLWKSGEPNNWHGREECGVIEPFGWGDVDCTLLYPFMCFDGRNTGNQSYIYISSTKSWHDAQAYCRQHHTDLTSSTDPAEDSVIKGPISGRTWIGLFRDSWKWTDQTNFSSLSWMTGQPDNALKNEACGYINNGQVADARCSDIMPFFCYADVTGQQQIVGVKIQSSEDVNDPAVMAAILAQMEKKLKEKGMKGNFTLKWRKQPDGAVFHKVEEENNSTVENKKCEL